MPDSEETTQQKIAQLKEEQIQQRAAAYTMLGIVQDNDKKLTEVLGTVRSTQAHEAIVDARLNTIDARINAWSQDMAASFRQVEATVATKEDLAEMETRMNGKFDRMEGRIDALVKEMNSKFDQVISLLTQKSGE